MKTYFVITLFPEMVKSFIQYGVLSQAIKNQLFEIKSINPRDFTNDVHKTVDDRPYGGGDGMIMMVDPLQRALESIPQDKRQKVIYLSPQGKKFDDQMARKLAQEENVVFVCGRYGGIDQRFINTYVHEEVSIGDYVLSGGELGAFVMIDAISRMVPGVLGHQDSAQEDSFAQGLLEYPHFTRPREILNQSVPEVLSSGNHKMIGDWRYILSLIITLKKRPDLLKNQDGTWKLNDKERRKIIDFWSQISPEVKKSCGLNDFKLEF